jgi:hypothetical protein
VRGRAGEKGGQCSIAAAHFWALVWP